MKLVVLMLLLLVAPAFAQDTVRTSQATELEELCTGTGSKVDAGSVGAALGGGFPCEIVRTDIALKRLNDREGFMAASTRGFLRARLFMRGLGSVIFGIVGLG